MASEPAEPHSMQPDDTPELRALYEGFAQHSIMPLWTQIGDLMPRHPRPKAVPHLWRWADLYPLAQKAGDLVPVGRGGERRALGLGNPGLGGNACKTSFRFRPTATVAS